MRFRVFFFNFLINRDLLQQELIEKCMLHYGLGINNAFFFFLAGMLSAGVFVAGGHGWP